MKEKKYRVKTKFVFEGEFYVKAESKKEAKKMVEESCGLCLGGNIHSDLNDEDVDWEFPVHPKKIVR